MEQLVELLKQIQELAGVGIDALEGAAKDAGGEKPEGKPEGGKPEGEGGPREEGKPPAAKGEGGPPAPEEEEKGGKPF